ncbi:hypothetical protein ACX4MV_11445 [Roseomonas mucosa]|nr:hypothetical protein NF552_26325 [Roseomonas mucosa]
MLDSVLAELRQGDMYAGKTLAERVAGRFYTPDVLASDLAVQLADQLEVRASRNLLGSNVRACDPFCGDGRLIVALLMEAAQRDCLRGRSWTVTLHDVERDAVEGASVSVSAAALSLGVKVRIRAIVGDSLATAAPQRHDVVMTNPPWELVKPDTRELAHMPQLAREDHRARLRALSDSLDTRFPEARADRAWAGWGTNLARCGWALSLRSCVPGGVLGIVLPSTILADQASATMRRSALLESRLVDIAVYPSEARLFARVDQPVVAATFVAEESSGVDASLRVFDANRLMRARSRLVIGEAELEQDGCALPVGIGAETCSLLAGLSGLPRLSDLEGRGSSSLWTGREMDETRIDTKVEPGLRYPFVKGRMVRRHGVAEAPSCSVLPALASRFRSTRFERIAWRDVARASQRRRMIGTVIPAGWVAGNSLHLAHFRDGDPERLRALHAVLSSFVLELQVRSRLATGHMSLGIVRMARIPPLEGSVVRKLARVGEAALAHGGEAQASLEVAVARAYGLDREAMAAVISQFPKVDAAERDAVLAPALWRGGRS